MRSEFKSIRNNRMESRAATNGAATRGATASRAATRGAQIMNRQARGRILSLILITFMVMSILAAWTDQSSAASKRYWLRVNKRANVVTAYQRVNGKWKPIRAMLCTTGAPGTPTPSGTFRIGTKFRWVNMVTEDSDTHEQYVSRFVGEYYFHSVWYYTRSYSAQSTTEFNRLGSSGSHGCVRLSTMDAKWIYDNCRQGTKVTVYSSKNPGPLGKPKPIRVPARGQYWDPTDPHRGNPYFIIRRPIITISKSKSRIAIAGRKYSLLKGVTAKDPNTYMNLTSRLRVIKMTRNGKAMKVKNFSTKRTGTYKVVYYLKDPYSKSARKTFTFKVVDSAPPTITIDKDRRISKAEVGETTSLVRGIRAKQPTGSRTKAISVLVTGPNGSQKRMTHEQAKTYTFKQYGTYTIEYSVSNKYKESSIARRSIKVHTYRPMISCVGLTRDAAEKQLTRLGIGYTVQEEASDTVPAGSVISQSFREGRRMYKASPAVVITVSTGPAITQ